MAAARGACLPRSRRGVTLVELLVVVSLLLILIAVLTTAMQPVIAGAELREAARQVNAYIAASIARASQTGRAAGVWIQRYDADNNPATPDNAAFEIFFAEVPPLYAGDFTNSRATVTASNSTAALTFISPLFGADNISGTKDDLVSPGDLIRLNYQGPWYPIATVSNSSVTYTVGDRPAPINQTNIPFQIRRLARKSPVDPLQLPANTVIDLANSGIGNGGNATAFNNASGPVLIMFSPDGSVDYVYSGGVATRVVATIFLLVGRPDQIGGGNMATANDNRWISINHQTGRITTSENMGGTIGAAREFATQGRGMGGRS